MKSLFTLLAFGFFAASAATAQTVPQMPPNKTREVKTVEASCGQCKLGLPGKSCDLAIRLDGQAYFVDGSDIDSHGDAHAKDGFCSAIRRAEVQGKVVNNRFVATYFKLLPESGQTE